MIFIVMIASMLATVLLFMIVFTPIGMLMFAEIETSLRDAGMRGELLHARAHARARAHTRVREHMHAHARTDALRHSRAGARPRAPHAVARIVTQCHARSRARARAHMRV